jgi:hypothetical protein
MVNYKKLFLIILLILTLIRLFGVNMPIVDDETNYIGWISDPGDYITVNPFTTHPHPPLGPWLFYGASKLFGSSTQIFRLIPLVLWIINSFLIFSMVKEEYNEKIAFFSSLFFGLSYYSVLMSLQIDVEGSLLVTSFLAISLFYLKYQRTKKTHNLIFAGLALGMGLFTKLSAFFILPTIALHSLISIKNKSILKSIISFENIKKTLFETSIIVFFGLLVFSIFPLLMPEIFEKMISHSSHYYGLNFSLLAISMFIFWSTPLLLGLSLCETLKLERKNSFWIIWLISIFSIYTFLISGRLGTQSVSGGITDYSRHFMNLLVPLSVLSGIFISKLKWRMHTFYTFGILTLIFTSIFFIINKQTTTILARDFSTYLNAITQFNFNFFFSFLTSSGNFLLINMWIFVIIFLTSLILILIYYFSPKKYTSLTLILFISLGIAFNIFLVSEYLGPVTSPNFENTYYDLVQEISQNNSITYYVNDEGFLLYLNKFQNKNEKNVHYIGKYAETLPMKIIPNDKFILLSLPDPNLHEIIQSKYPCVTEKKIYSKNTIVANILVCH